MSLGFLAREDRLDGNAARASDIARGRLVDRRFETHAYGAETKPAGILAENG